MQPPLKRLSTGTGQQEGQRMQDVDENFGRLETEVDLLNAILGLKVTVTYGILEYARGLAGSGLFVVTTGPTAFELPHNDYRNSFALIFASTPTNRMVVAFNRVSMQIAINYLQGASWNGWKIIG